MLIHAPEPPGEGAVSASYGDLVERITQARFTPVRLRHEGYDMGAVDDLLDRVVAALGRGEAVIPVLDAARLGKVRLREGYDIAEVDRFLRDLRDSVEG
jgi:DivIVA domain-containing protein